MKVAPSTRSPRSWSWSFVVLAACGAATADAPPADQDGDGVADPVDHCPLIPEDRDGYADEDGCPEGSPPGEEEWRPSDPLPQARAGTPPPGPACASQGDCSEREQCVSPEEASWNSCGPPHASNCAANQVGDFCGHCFAACSADADCSATMTCNGRYCISPRQCRAMRPPPQ